MTELLFRADAYQTAAECRIIEAALRQCEGSVAKAAELLLTPKKTLYDKLTRHAIQAESFRPG